jgi:hypothetical protein
MHRKISKWIIVTVFFSLALAAFVTPARGIFDNTRVQVGTELEYDMTGTECYISWNYDIFINMTYTNTTHAFGNITDTSSNHLLLQNGENLSLSIFVIRNVTDWAQSPNINNHTTSQMLENWDPTHVNTKDSGVYEDTTRDTVSINFTIITNEPTAGEVVQNIKIAWDEITGVLVEYDLVQTNADPQFSGTWSMTLTETSLWGITPEGVPGYPLEMLLVAFAAGICGVFLSKKVRRRASE